MRKIKIVSMVILLTSSLLGQVAMKNDLGKDLSEILVMYGEPLDIRPIDPEDIDSGYVITYIKP